MGQSRKLGGGDISANGAELKNCKAALTIDPCQPTGSAGVDPFFLNLKDNPDVYVSGDSFGVVFPNFNFYPKAGHVANKHAKIVAKYIAERVKGIIIQDQDDDNLRREDVVSEDFAWAGRMYEDMFG